MIYIPLFDKCIKCLIQGYGMIANASLPATNYATPATKLSECTTSFNQRYLTAIRTYFTRWLIRTNSYDLTRTI